MIGPAFAADLPSYKSAPVYAPPPPAFSWTGFYVDAGAGYGEWNANTVTRNAGTAICRLCANQTQGGRGFLGRGGIGFDYQFTDHLVAGVFADGTYGGLNGTIQDQDPFYTGNVDQNWSWAAGGRLGWLITPDLLAYGDAGFTRAHFSGANFFNSLTGAATGNSTPGFSTNGWFAGGGFESMFAPGWFFRTEYRVAGYGANILSDGGATLQHDIRFQPIVQTVTSGLVYKFGWPGSGMPGLPSFTQITDGFSPPPATTNWTGFYADAGVGYGLWSANTTTISPATGVCVICLNERQGGRGVFGTVGAGYDYQMTSKIVGGVFGEFDPSAIRGTIQDQGPYFAGTISQNWAWDAGGRLGWLVTPQVMTYTKAGFTQARFGGTQMQSTFAGNYTGFYTPGFTTNGWFLGGGVEAEFAPGWFWRAEYRYAQYGTRGIADTASAGGADDTIRFRPEEQTATLGLVYKFNWAAPAPPPVVAKY
jgi:outer membrane immunogenic protein